MIHGVSGWAFVSILWRNLPLDGLNSGAFTGAVLAQPDTPSLCSPSLEPR